MISLRTFLILAVMALPSLMRAEGGAQEVGTWELVSIEMSKREGQEFPVHRLILTADGKYLNSATRGGPIPTNYKLEEDKDSGGSYAFIIEAPNDHLFGRAAGLRINEGRLKMTYFDGRVLTYVRISEVADKKLLVSPDGKNITIKPNKTMAEQDGNEQPTTRPESKSESSDKPQHEAEGRSE